MSTEQIQKRVIEIISYLTHTDPRTIKSSSHLFGDLGIDSLDLLEVFMECEKNFGIDIDSSKERGCERVSDLVSIIDIALGNVELQTIQKTEEK